MQSCLIIWSLKNSLLLIVGLATLASSQGPPPKSIASDGDFNNVNTDGSYDFGYDNKDRGASYHLSQANRANVVRGRFGSRDPTDGNIKETIYTAGPRGFRARGPHIHRRMDLDQRPRGPIGNKDDPYFDPNEDPSYSFGFKTSTYEKQEDANRRGDVTGRYSFVDDIGERHNVEYIAGKDTGFHVKTAYPDSNPASIGPLFYNGPLVRGEKKQRGHTSIQRGLDGSYRFISAGPDQRRTESSDSNGNVRGSYSFIDDKGVQRTVHYIAGPGIGYRVIKNNKDPFIPSFFPVLPDYRDPALNKPFPTTGPFVSDNTFPGDKTDTLDDIFGRPGGAAASGHIKPPKNNRKPTPGGGSGEKGNDLFDKDDDAIFGTSSKERPSPGPGSFERPSSGSQERPGSSQERPVSRPRPGGTGTGGTFGPQSGERPTNIVPDDDEDDFFGKPPSAPSGSKPSGGSTENASGGDFPNLDAIKPSSGEEDDNDLFGDSKPSRPGVGSRPTGNGRPGNIRPGSSGGRPGISGSRPGSNGRPDNFGRPESGNKPTRPGGSYNGDRPDTGYRPVGRPGGRPVRPGGRPIGRPGGRPITKPGSRPDSRPSSEESGRPKPDDFFDTDTKPGSGFRPGDRPSDGYKPVRPGRPDSGGDKPHGSGFKPGEDGVSFVDLNDDDIFGATPPGGSSSTYPGRPGKDEGKKPNSSGESGRPGSDYRPGGSGLDKPSKTDSGSGLSGSDISSTDSDKPVGPPIPGGFLDSSKEDKRGDKDKHVGVYPIPGGDTEITFGGPADKNIGGTIFTNLGAESIHFPPGKSVRAHVQSIDLIPFGTKVPSPAEAIESELKKHGSR